MTNTPSKKEFSFDLDERTKKTMIWSGAFYALASAIENFASQSSWRFYGGIMGEWAQLSRMYGMHLRTFNFDYLLSAVIWGAISGVIFGFILSKFYPQIKEINKKHLKGKLNTMFKLLFYPTLLGSVVYIIIGGAFSFSIGFLPILVVFAGSIVGHFLYAKLLTAKIEKDYPPMV
jgi:C4-dicarboxylate transporter